MGKKYRFQNDDWQSYEARVFLILNDETLEADEKKRLVNRVRLDCMTQHKYYSAEMQQLDNFIRKTYKSRQNEPKRAAAS